jgi:hypothetical protein
MTGERSKDVEDANLSQGKSASRDASDSDLTCNDDSSQEQSTRKPLPKRPSSITLVKKGSKCKSSKKIPDDGSDVLMSVNTAIKDIGEKLLSRVEQKDDIRICVEGLEVKLRTIKNRAIQLRLIDNLERLASKFVMEDYIKSQETQEVASSSTSQKQQPATTVRYCPPPVQPITPPHCVQRYSTVESMQSSLPAMSHSVPTSYTSSLPISSTGGQGRFASILDEALHLSNIPTCCDQEANMVGGVCTTTSGNEIPTCTATYATINYVALQSPSHSATVSSDNIQTSDTSNASLLMPSNIQFTAN